MDADYSTAFRTLPSNLLPCDKSLEPKFSYAFEILHHAHAVSRSVTFVQLPYSSTREFGALKTKFLFASLHLGAIFYSANDTMLWLVGIIAITARARFFLSEIPYAEAAVHPARRNHI
jgi:hypothetical protein